MSFPMFMAGMLTLFFAPVWQRQHLQADAHAVRAAPGRWVIGCDGHRRLRPFLFGMLFAASFGAFKSAAPVFAVRPAAFFAFNVVLNWWMYARRGACQSLLTPRKLTGAHDEPFSRPTHPFLCTRGHLHSTD